MSGPFGVPRGMMVPGELEPESWNVARIILGGVESGKTTMACRMLLNAIAQPAIVLAHDVQRRIPRQLFDGTRIPLERFESLPELRSGVKGGQVNAIGLCDEEKLVAMAADIGQSSGYAVILYFDELSLCEFQGLHSIAPWFKRRYVQRRRDNLGFVFSAQNLSMVHKILVSCSTGVYSTRMPTGDTARLIARGASPDVGKILPGLSLYEWVKIRVS